jgi:hypothetical protein
MALVALQLQEMRSVAESGKPFTLGQSHRGMPTDSQIDIARARRGKLALRFVTGETVASRPRFGQPTCQQLVRGPLVTLLKQSLPTL